MEHLRDGAVTKRIQIVEERHGAARGPAPCGGGATNWALVGCVDGAMARQASTITARGWESSL